MEVTASGTQCKGTHSHSQQGLTNIWLRWSSTQQPPSLPQISTSASHQYPHWNLLSPPALPTRTVATPGTLLTPPCGTVAAHSVLVPTAPEVHLQQGHRLTLCHPFTV